MNYVYAAGTAVYELCVTLAVLVGWESLLLLFQFLSLNSFSNALAVSPGSVWVFTVFMALVLSVAIDFTQVYTAAEQDEIRTLPIYGVRVATNYVIYLFLMTVIAYRHGFTVKPVAAEKQGIAEEATFQNGVDMAVLDGVNVSIGRVFITLVQGTAAAVSTAHTYWKDGNRGVGS